MCSHMCVSVCTEFCASSCLYYTVTFMAIYITPAWPTLRNRVQVPDTPLNPLHGTLTASQWETDPEGPGTALFMLKLQTHTTCCINADTL